MTKPIDIKTKGVHDREYLKVKTLKREKLVVF